VDLSTLQKSKAHSVMSYACLLSMVSKYAVLPFVTRPAVMVLNYWILLCITSFSYSYVY